MKRRTMRPRECVLMLCDQQRHKLRLALRSLWAGLAHMARLQGANSIPPPVRGRSTAFASLRSKCCRVGVSRSEHASADHRGRGWTPTRLPPIKSGVADLPLSGGGIARSAAMTAVALWFGHALAQAPAGAPSETAQGMVGAWEISNAARDKTCAVSFSVDTGEGGFKLDLDPTCRTVFPSLRDVGAWAIGPKDSVQLLDAKGAVVLDFAEVESRMYEAERKGEGLFFMRTQAAIRAATITPDQLFGDWTLLQEFEKPLCKLTLSNTSAGGTSYQIIVKPGCTASIAGFAPSTWRIEDNELVFAGRSGAWRFSESDATTWERIPPSTDPLLMMRQ
jgi:hypothetical protein